MTPYRGPDSRRIAEQFGQIALAHAVTATVRTWVSAGPTTGSAYLAGGGSTDYFQQRTISGLWVAPRNVDFNVHPVPGGQVMDGDMMFSTPSLLTTADRVQWQGAEYRVVGEPFPVRMNGVTWYRTLLRRGDVV